ncbi:hypothetical protein LDENG_00285510 [Lucifuga dentata]|nr:hypothetical protein LDENG_00285510 [Lucifuga dentata]
MSERLTAVAEEILGVFEKTLAVYQEEIVRQRKLLDIIYKPESQLIKTDPPQLRTVSVWKENVVLDQQHCSQEMNSGLGQVEADPAQIKEEQKELCIIQKEEQVRLQQERDLFKLSFAFDGNDHSEEQTQLLDAAQAENAADEEPPHNVVVTLIKSEFDRESFGVSEPNNFAENKEGDNNGNGNRSEKQEVSLVK